MASDACHVSEAGEGGHGRGGPRRARELGAAESPRELTADPAFGALGRVARARKRGARVRRGADPGALWIGFVVFRCCSTAGGGVGRGVMFWPGDD